MSPAQIVQKLLSACGHAQAGWNYCNVLRDDGMSYGDYVEQLTYLLFLKMADERSKPPYVPASQSPARTGNQSGFIPKEYDWQSLYKLSLISFNIMKKEKADYEH